MTKYLLNTKDVSINRDDYKITLNILQVSN